MRGNRERAGDARRKSRGCRAAGKKLQETSAVCLHGFVTSGGKFAMNTRASDFTSELLRAGYGSVAIARCWDENPAWQPIFTAVPPSRRIRFGHVKRRCDGIAPHGRLILAPAAWYHQFMRSAATVGPAPRIRTLSRR